MKELLKTKKPNRNNISFRSTLRVYFFIYFLFYLALATPLICAPSTSFARVNQCSQLFQKNTVQNYLVPRTSKNALPSFDRGIHFTQYKTKVEDLPSPIKTLIKSIKSKRWNYRPYEVEIGVLLVHTSSRVFTLFFTSKSKDLLGMQKERNPLNQFGQERGLDLEEALLALMHKEDLIPLDILRIEIYHNHPYLKSEPIRNINADDYSIMLELKRILSVNNGDSSKHIVNTSVHAVQFTPEGDILYSAYSDQL